MDSLLLLNSYSELFTNTLSIYFGTLYALNFSLFSVHGGQILHIRVPVFSRLSLQWVHWLPCNCWSSFKGFVYRVVDTFTLTFHNIFLLFVLNILFSNAFPRSNKFFCSNTSCRLSTRLFSMIIHGLEHHFPELRFSLYILCTIWMQIAPRSLMWTRFPTLQEVVKILIYCNKLRGLLAHQYISH